MTNGTAPRGTHAKTVGNGPQSIPNMGFLRSGEAQEAVVNAITRYTLDESMKMIIALKAEAKKRRGGIALTGMLTSPMLAKVGSCMSKGYS